MEIWQSMVLGLVQGIGEFLPISSSGHLMLIQRWFGISGENAFFYSIMLHVGTLIPVIVVLWKEIIKLFKMPMDKFGLLVLATIPAGVMGIIFTKVIDLEMFFDQYIWLLGITFLLTAAELLYSERLCKKAEMINPINVKTSLIMGAGQAFGVIPGLSRSGTTITAGCIGRVDREKNASFTFLMSIPIILAAAGMELLDVIQTPGAMADINVVALLLGMFTAMVSGYISIKFMLKIIKKANYKWFSLYLVLISVATFVTAFVM